MSAPAPAKPGPPLFVRLRQAYGSCPDPKLAPMEGTGRLETFADGVFAIAATLLILDVHRTGDASVAASLVHAWPSYLAYAISFFTIGIIWVNHHTVMKQIDRVDRTFLFLNVLFLMVVAFSPFPTRVL